MIRMPVVLFSSSDGEYFGVLGCVSSIIHTPLHKGHTYLHQWYAIRYIWQRFGIKPFRSQHLETNSWFIIVAVADSMVHEFRFKTFWILNDLLRTW